MSSRNTKFMQALVEKKLLRISFVKILKMPSTNYQGCSFKFHVTATMIFISKRYSECKRQTNILETTIIQLYQHGVTAC